MAKQTYNEIKQMRVAELNAICRNFNTDTSLHKTVEVNAACHCLDISTNGGSQLRSTLTDLTSIAEALTKLQLQELHSLTPKAMTGWSSDLSELPSVDDTDVKRFLLQTEILTAPSERTYKLSQPYQLKQFVNALQVCSVPSFYVIRARCLPSLSTDKDDVKLMQIVIDKHTGQPFGGYCTCTVGCVYFITLL